MKNTSMLTSLKRSKDVLYILILALVVALVWIIIGVYHAAVKTSIPANIQKLTTPLSPTLDTETLQGLSSRTLYTDQELQSFPINREIIDDKGVVQEVSTPVATPTPAASGSATARNASGSATTTADSTPTPTPSTSNP
jgi:hypothetical protein